MPVNLVTSIDFCDGTMEKITSHIELRPNDDEGKFDEAFDIAVNYLPTLRLQLLRSTNVSGLRSYNVLGTSTIPLVNLPSNVSLQETFELDNESTLTLSLRLEKVFNAIQIFSRQRKIFASGLLWEQSLPSFLGDHCKGLFKHFSKPIQCCLVNLITEQTTSKSPPSGLREVFGCIRDVFVDAQDIFMQSQLSIDFPSGLASHSTLSASRHTKLVSSSRFSLETQQWTQESPCVDLTLRLVLPDPAAPNDVYITFPNKYQLWKWSKYFRDAVEIWNGSLDPGDSFWAALVDGDSREVISDVPLPLTVEKTVLTGLCVLSLEQPWILECREPESNLPFIILNLQSLSDVVVSVDAAPAPDLILEVDRLSVTQKSSFEKMKNSPEQR